MLRPIALCVSMDVIESKRSAGSQVTLTGHSLLSYCRYICAFMLPITTSSIVQRQKL